MDFWALWAISLIVKVMAGLLAILGLLFVCVASVTPIMIPVASIGMIGFIQISYVLICLGWFLGCLGLYGFGQFIVLMLRIEENTYMTYKYTKGRREAQGAQVTPERKRKNIWSPPTREY